MSQVCRLCSRVNPAEALYCYYDGAPLDAALGAPLAIGRQPFGHPFVFPDGRNCRNFDELILACEDDWQAGADMLRRGFFSSFFDAVGRPDLGHAARQSAKLRDRDRGLDQLLGQLPCTARPAASLVVQPLELNLGQLTDAAAPQFSLHLFNQGGGMIYGSVVAEADWLALGDAPGAPRKMFQFHVECEVAAHVVRKNLRAGPKPIDGRLVVETNAGLALVLVRIEVPNQPFPHGVLAGAATPRDLAKKAKASPKEAARLFESGAVRQWYEDNGWSYPIPKGQAAPGLASVQQFFEVLGLVKPPRVEISERSVALSGKPGEALQHTLHVHTPEKKYIFVQARSTVDWLRVVSQRTAGQRGQIVLRVPHVPALPGNRLNGFVHVTANGGQHFAVKVQLGVAGKRAQEAIEVVPITGSEDVQPVKKSAAEPTETIPIAPTKLDDLIPVDPDDQLTGEGSQYE